MFKFFKEKLKNALSVFSKKAEEEAEEILEQPRIQEKPIHKPAVPFEKPPERKEPAPVAKKPTEEKKEPTEEKKKPADVQQPSEGKKPAQETKEQRKEEPALQLPKHPVKGDEVLITYFVHGTTTDNEQGRSSGWSDVGLSPLGNKQSIDLQKKIHDRFDAIFSSDLRRAVASAHLTWPHETIIQDQRLRECNYGELTSKQVSLLDDYARKHDLQTVPFPGGESLRDVEARIRSLINDFYKKYQGKHVGIVAHKNTQLAIEVLLQGKTWQQAIKDDWREQHPKAWQPGWDYIIKHPLAEPKREAREDIHKEIILDKKIDVREAEHREEKPHVHPHPPQATPHEHPRETIPEEEKVIRHEHLKESIIQEKEAREEPGEKQEKRGFLAKIFGRKEEKQTPQREKPREEAKPSVETPHEEKAPAKEPAPSLQPASPLQESRPARHEEERKELHEQRTTPMEKKEKPREQHPEEKKPSLFKRISETFTTVQLSDKKFEEIFWDLEVVMLENNVAVEVIEKIRDDLRHELTQKRIPRGGIEDIVLSTLKQSISELFSVEQIDIIREAKRKKPYVIAVIGVNGSGKTTTLAKLARLFLDNHLSCVIAASDTFRAAAIQQLEEHAERLGVKLIKQDYKADPAAVAFDAIAHAKAKGIDIVLIDTAGRLHSNDNLMNELKKLIKVNAPDLKVFVGESITGNDCIEQARVFDEAVGIDGIILAKADVDEKGGAAVSVSYVTKKPILYIGTGQKYEDLKKFEPSIVLENLGL